MKLPTALKPKEVFKDTFQSEAEKILNHILEEIERHAFKAKRASDDAFNHGWREAHRRLFFYCMDRGIKPVTYEGRLLLEHRYPPTAEQTKQMEKDIEEARAKNII